MSSIHAGTIKEQQDWSIATFGPGLRTKGVVDHIKKELNEILSDPEDMDEWVDVLILAFDGAQRLALETGRPVQEIIDRFHVKQLKNRSRKWPDWRTADPDKAIEHDRTGE